MTRSFDLLVAFRALPCDEQRRLLRELEAEVTGDARASAERGHVWFLESLDRVNRVMHGSSELESMLSRVLEVTLELFGCDRAWLVSPGDPSSKSWRVVMEHTRPEFPGAFARSGPLPIDAATAEAFRLAFEAEGAVLFGPGYEHALPPVASAFQVHSQMALALYPKGAQPYVLGLHQCEDRGPWQPQERRLFEELGLRLADALASVLALRSLRDSERRLDDAQRIAHVGYWDRDMVSGQVTLSDEACRIFGFSPADRSVDLPTWHARWLSLLDPRDRTHTSEAFMAAMNGGPRYDVEYRIIRSGGEVRTIHSRGEVEWGRDGQPTRMFGVMQDVTEMVRLEEQLRQSQKLEAIGRLAGGVAHDFNNLLTVINGSTDLALLETTDPAMAPLLAEIRESGQRAASLTRQLLAFSRQQVLEPQVVDLNNVLSHLGNLLERVIGEDIELSLRQEPRLGLVKLDASQFEQAILNLAINARDAMPDGGSLKLETSDVELGEEFVTAQPDMRAGRYARVTVADSGMGMDSATLARIFEPFFTTKPVGKGTGLGLAMVYGFIKQSGGHIEVQSELGQGSAFRLYLPVAESTLGVPPRPSTPLRQRTGNETILLVEDEDAVRRVCRRILGALGYRLLEASNGEEALALAARHPGELQLLLTDLIMPRLGGRVLAAKLRETLPELRILFLSGYTEDAALMQELEGGVAFVQKPFTGATLGAKVRALLDGPPPRAKAGF